MRLHPLFEVVALLGGCTVDHQVRDLEIMLISCQFTYAPFFERIPSLVFIQPHEIFHPGLSCNIKVQDVHGRIPAEKISLQIGTYETISSYYQDIQFSTPYWMVGQRSRR